MSNDEYRRVLAKWASTQLPADLGPVTVTDVRLDYDEGHGAWSSWTAGDPPSLDVHISYRQADGQTGSYTVCDGEKVALNMSTLLLDLFAVADVEVGRGP